MGVDTVFYDKMHEVAEQAQQRKELVRGNEEATKQSLVQPFFDALGYDIYDPAEFQPEYVADFGARNGEKVDYAILDGGKPLMLIECKAYGEKLDRHHAQLLRYFTAVPAAKIGVLTDGVAYRFYSDLDPNPEKLMDDDPFLVVNLLSLADSAIVELERYRKPSFDQKKVLERAEKLKHGRLIRERILRELDIPSDELVCLVIDGFYEGVKTSGVKERYRALVREQLQGIIDDKAQRLFEEALSKAGKAAEGGELGSEGDAGPSANTSHADALAATGDDGISAYYQEGYRVVCDVLKGAFGSFSETSCERTTNYLRIDFCGKWICQIWGQGKRRINVYRPDGVEDRFYIDDVEDLRAHSDELITAARYRRERA